MAPTRQMHRDDEPITELPALTPRQLDVLTAIYRYWQDCRHAPTHRELATQLGAKASTAAPWIRVLEDRGYVYRDPPRGRRNLRISGKAVEKLQLEGRVARPEP